MTRHNLIGELVKYILKNSLYKFNKFEGLQITGKTGERNPGLRSEDIDTGVCGIILFLVELYRTGKSPGIKKALIEAGDDLIRHCKENDRSHFGFFKGRAGVCFTLIKISEITNEARYLDFALLIIKNNSESFIESDCTSNRLYDGRPGLLIVLLHLYNNIPEKWILERMQDCLRKIVRGFIPAKAGIIWDREDNNIKPVISYFNGSPGVAFALNEYGNYFGNSVIMRLAKEIIEHEDHHWKNKTSCCQTLETKYYRQQNLKISITGLRGMTMLSS